MGKYNQYSDEFKKESSLARKPRQTEDDHRKRIRRHAWFVGTVAETIRINEETDELELREVEHLKAEVRRLKREAEILRQERDILKKTVVIFSKDPK